MKIELIYDETCPNFEAARNELKEALNRLGLPLQWREWRRDESSAPAFAAQYGSPTILVNGTDVAGQEPESALSCCRLYEDTTGHLKKARLTGKTWDPILKTGPIAWDVYLIYPPSATWEKEPPAPSFWMQQLRGIKHAPRLDRTIFEAKVREILNSMNR